MNDSINIRTEDWTEIFDGELGIALSNYEKMFGDMFPTSIITPTPDDEFMEMINKCIAEKKDVYEMGYLTLSEDVQY